MPTIRYKQPTSDKAIASNGTAAVTVFTFGTGLLNPDDSASGFGGIIDAIDVYNSDTVSHDCKLYLIASGGSLDDTTLIERFTLPASGKIRIPGPYRCKDSATVQIKLGEAHTSTAVYTKVEVSEIH